MRKQTAELGYWLGTDYTGRGLGSAACQLLLSKTFIERPLDQIFIRCEEENYASQAIARRLGFSFLEKKGSILSFGMTREKWLFNYYEEEDLLCFWEEEELLPPILLD
jgi:ribosomal-protein-serine acetyltransferase